MEEQRQDCCCQETTGIRERGKQPGGGSVMSLFPLFSKAEVLSSLSHRNIVQFFGAVTTKPNYSLVTGENGIWVGGANLLH